MHRIRHHTFAIDLNFHLGESRGQNRVGGIQVDWSNHAPHSDGLIFGIDPDILGALENQVAVPENMRNPRRHRGCQGSSAAGCTLSI